MSMVIKGSSLLVGAIALGLGWNQGIAAQGEGEAWVSLPPGEEQRLAQLSAYEVYVNGSSPLLLDQVRQIDSQAFVTTRQGQSVIQAGSFNQWESAQQRVQALNNFGIGAEVVPQSDVPQTAAPQTAVPQTVANLPVLPSATVSAAPTTVARGVPYVVLVEGSSAARLNQVQLVEPDAFVRTYEGRSVIQAGSFNQWDNAQQRVQALRAVGVTADVVSGTGAGASVAAVPNSTATPPQSAASLPSPQGYYVVIPGDQATLPAIANRVVALGAPTNLVRQRSAPRGPHVAVGPFADRGLAEDWRHYFRGQGLGDSRVHFE